jgi:hypothetical protein
VIARAAITAAALNVSKTEPFPLLGTIGGPSRNYKNTNNILKKNLNNRM